MTNTYDVNDQPRIRGTFTDADAAATDPTAVVLIVTDPSGADTGYQYGLSDQGTWDASTNTPALADGTGTAGHYYTVLVAGSVDFGNGSLTFAIDDAVYYDGTYWQKLPSLSATALTKESTGVYYVDHQVDEAGLWTMHVEGIGTGQSADEWHLWVRERETS